MTKAISVWGFEAGDLRGWPADLEPVHRWPVGSEPVLVHAREVASFMVEADRRPMPDGRMVDAILYLPPGGRLSPQQAGYFDTAVTEGDWETLRGLLACPQQFRSEELVLDLPAEYIRRLGGPESDGELDWGDLPVAPAGRAHLANCETCQTAFRRAVAKRFSLLRSLQCPAPERLRAFVQAGEQDPAIGRHLSECPDCQVEVQVLAKELKQRVNLADWLTVSFGSRRRIVEEPGAALKALLRGLLTGLKPAEAWARSPSAGRRAPGVDLQTLAEQLQRGKPVTFLKPGRDLTVGWDAEGSAVWIGSLHGDQQSRVTDFEVELRSRQAVVWTAHSEGGRVTIPLDLLENAVLRGVDRLVIYALSD